jgi:glucuronosyltransferase
MARAELLGWGAQVSYQDLNEALFSEALENVLHNPKYTTNVKMVANRLRDQPQTPMQKAIFWVEYVLRHDGAYFMQSSAQHLNFIEVHNLDIYATLAAIACLVILIPIIMICKIVKLLRSNKTKKLSMKSTKKLN